MKKVISILTVFVFTLFFSISSIAQPPPPPGNGGGPNANDHEIGGNAPIGGGLFILIGLGAAYGGRKVYRLVQEEKLEE